MGIGGWWIDSIAITQTNWACCGFGGQQQFPSIRSPDRRLPIQARGDGRNRRHGDCRGGRDLYDNGASNETLHGRPPTAFSARRRSASSKGRI